MVSRKTRIPWMMGIACSLLMACSSKQQDCLGEMPVIAEKVALPTGDLIVCDLAKATDTLDIPLSMLTEELQIVPLYLGCSFEYADGRTADRSAR